MPLEPDPPPPTDLELQGIRQGAEAAAADFRRQAAIARMEQYPGLQRLAMVDDSMDPDATHLAVTIAVRHEGRIEVSEMRIPLAGLERKTAYILIASVCEVLNMAVH